MNDFERSLLLHECLVRFFSLVDLETACMVLSIPPDQILMKGEPIAAAANRLILHCRMRRSLPGLIEYVVRLRPEQPEVIRLAQLSKQAEAASAGIVAPASAVAADAAGTAERNYASCFLSYDSRDHEFAAQLHASLENARVDCFFAPDDLKPGEWLRETLYAAIAVRDRMVLVVSSRSLDSHWVKNEVETTFEREAHEKEAILLPVTIDDAIFSTTVPWAATIRRERHIADFREWRDPAAYRQAVAALLPLLRQ